MKRLPEVETAKTLMTEATTWSVMKWLREKKRVRATADQANAALDRVRQTIGESWHSETKSAYAALVDNTRPHTLQSLNDEIRQALRKVKEADDEAALARADAEQTFDNAERQLSTRLAREGCRKAIESWDLHEKAIQKAEALMHAKR
jgi:uncharacterized protein YukE